MGEKYDTVLSSMQRKVDIKSFEKYIVHSQQNKNELIFNIRTSKLIDIPRFNAWQLLLQIIPFTENWEQKIVHLEEHRKRWDTLRDGEKSPKKVASKQGPLSVARNPLMKGMVKTQKKETQSDSFLKQQIKKDVNRTYQEIQFFQDQNVLKILTSVLFVWCKANSQISYKQGMNEILAIIVWVYFQEAAASHYSPSNEAEKKYKQLNNISFAEADIFAVFDKIMEIQKEMFKENLDVDVKGVINPNSKINSPILQRISQIQDYKLKILDIELYRALKLQDVKTKTFLLRWIRCLHSREFGLIGCLPIWDSIFLDHYECNRQKKQFEFVDAMCLSMFIYLRSIVLTLESTGEILKVYQKYPELQGQYLQELLGLAWSISQQLRNSQTKNQSQETQIKIQKKNELKECQTSVKTLNTPNKSEDDPALRSTGTKQKASQQSKPKNQSIIFDNAQLKGLIDKLIQSNSYNQNGQSKKLVRQCIEKMEQKLL